MAAVTVTKAAPPVDEYVDVKKSVDIAPTPAASSKRLVKALYDYNPENSEELTMKAGDMVSVLEVNTDGWWLGELGSKQGEAIIYCINFY